MGSNQPQSLSKTSYIHQMSQNLVNPTFRWGNTNGRILKWIAHAPVSFQEMIMILILPIPFGSRDPRSGILRNDRMDQAEMTVCRSIVSPSG